MLFFYSLDFETLLHVFRTDCIISKNKMLLFVKPWKGFWKLGCFVSDKHQFWLLLPRWIKFLFQCLIAHLKDNYYHTSIEDLATAWIVTGVLKTTFFMPMYFCCSPIPVIDKKFWNLIIHQQNQQIFIVIRTGHCCEYENYLF